MAEFRFSVLDIPVVVSDGMAPDEVAVIGPYDGARWTPDGGVESLSQYQLSVIHRLVCNARCR